VVENVIVEGGDATPGVLIQPIEETHS